MTGFRLGLLAVLLIVLISGLVGTRILERSLRTHLESALNQTFGCEARAGKLAIHWTSRTLEVEGLSLLCPMARKEEGGRRMLKLFAPPSPKPLVFVRRLEARFDLFSLLNRVVALESLKVEGGRVTALSTGTGDNYRAFLDRWISGAHPALSGAATIRTISIRDTDLSLNFADQGIEVTLHAVSGALKPNLFMNRFRLTIPSGSLSGKIHGHVVTSSFLRASASFAQGGVPDLDILARLKSGFLELQGQVLSFDTEPVVSLFAHGSLPLAMAGELMRSTSGSDYAPPEGSLEFQSYLHGRMNHLKARAVFSSSSLRVGSIHMTDLRMILSWRPGQLLARPVRLTLNGTKIDGRIRADLEGNHPVAFVEVNEKGKGGLMGTFVLSASGTIPLPSRPEGWEAFLASLKRLARVS